MNRAAHKSWPKTTPPCAQMPAEGQKPTCAFCILRNTLAMVGDFDATCCSAALSRRNTVHQVRDMAVACPPARVSYKQASRAKNTTVIGCTTPARTPDLLPICPRDSSIKRLTHEYVLCVRRAVTYLPKCAAPGRQAPLPEESDGPFVRNVPLEDSEGSCFSLGAGSGCTPHNFVIIPLV